MRTAAAGVMTLLPLVLLAGACGTDPVHVDAATVEDWLETAYYGTDDPDPAAVEVDCPGDLEAEVDATIRCEMERGDAYYEVEVTVTAVDGESPDDVEWESQIVQRGY